VSVDMEPIRTIRWVDGAVRIIDQRRLPRVEREIDLRTPGELIRAIRSLAVRGAPALGIAGAYGVALAAAVLAAGQGAHADPVPAIRRSARRIATCRPTAVNLSMGVDRALKVLSRWRPEPGVGTNLVEVFRQVGERMLEEDLEASRRMAVHGAPLVPAGQAVVTHCNTGGLATGGLGTALAVVRAAHAAQGIREVLVDETRPLLQGGRLTLWELARWGVPARLMCDGASGWALRRLGVGCVVVGADRIAVNGDTANKVGTLNLAMAAHSLGVPFYVVAPSSSFDSTLASGEGIEIEERSAGEVLAASGWRNDAAVRAFNPAFDVTPAAWITAWVTEKGVQSPPFSGS
jgi:methylthioribose-1-phosphate isomerase